MFTFTHAIGFVNTMIMDANTNFLIDVLITQMSSGVIKVFIGGIITFNQRQKNDFPTGDDKMIREKTNRKGGWRNGRQRRQKERRR